MSESKKAVSRVFSRMESEHVFKRFEEVHCYRKNEEGEPVLDEKGQCVEQCPGWDWDLEHVGEDGQPAVGGCRYKKSSRLCEVLRLAAEGHHVLEVRPRNQEDDERERKKEIEILQEHLRRIRNQRSELDEQILAIENKIRNL